MRSSTGLDPDDLDSPGSAPSDSTPSHSTSPGVTACASASAGSGGGARRWAVLGVYIAAMCMNGLDSTIVNPALYRIAEAFGEPLSAVAAVETAFLVALAVALPASGWLTDRFGVKRVMLVSLAAFTLASTACAAAPTLDALIAARAAQGLAGGILTPAGMTLLFRAFEPDERMRLGTVIVVPTALMPALGPPLGGFLAQHASWPWLFLVNVPIGVVTVAVGVWALSAAAPDGAEAFDRSGFILCAIALGCLVAACAAAPVRGWAEPFVLAGLAVGLVGLGALVSHQRRAAHPLLALRLLDDALYGPATLLAGFSAAALMAVLFVVPMLVQARLGGTALDAGLAVFPEALGLMVSSAVVRRALPRIGPRALAATSFAAATLVLAVLAVPAVVSDAWSVRTAMFVLGCVLGTAVLTVQIAGFDTIAPPDMGHAMGLFQIVRTVAGALGITAAAALTHSAGYVVASALSAALVAACVVVALRLPAQLQSPPRDDDVPTPEPETVIDEGAPT